MLLLIWCCAKLVLLLQYQMLHLMQQIHHSNDKDTKYANQDTKYANQNYLNQKNRPNKTPGTPSKSKGYANLMNFSPNMQCIDLCCFVARQFLMGIYALFLRTFYRSKKCGGVPKMTNIRYDRARLVL